MFYDRFKQLCDKKGISCTKAASEIGLSNATAAKWKRTGAVPNGASLELISKYFGVSIDYLLGRQEDSTCTSVKGAVPCEQNASKSDDISLFLDKLNQALDTLNFYRNQHYADGSNTESGQLADAINTVLPALLKSGILKQLHTGKWIVRYECPHCGEITRKLQAFCPFCKSPLIPTVDQEV